MKRIAFANQKGGVGKTTTTLNLGVGLAMAGCRVLLVDLDAQANLTEGLGFRAEELDTTIFDVLSGVVPVRDALLERPIMGGGDPLHLLPSSIQLSAADIQLAGRMGREQLLRQALASTSEADYDYILMDCPPNLGLLTINALVAATDVVVIAQSHYYAMKGMTNLWDAIDEVKKFYNAQLSISGIVVTLFDARKNLNKDVEESFRDSFDELVFSTVIRDNVTLAEAPSYGLSIFEHGPQSHGAEDYRALTKELLARFEKKKRPGQVVEVA